MGYSHALGSRFDPRVKLPARQTHILRTISYILGDRFLKKLVLRILKHNTDLKPYIADIHILPPDILAVNENQSRGRLHQTV